MAGERAMDDGLVLDRYQIIGQIAAGGMATVSLGRIEGVGGFQRFVAIKRLHPHLAQEPEFVEMFLDEARLAAKIHHQNVVPILEIGASGGHYFLVMEYIEGATLGRLMARALSRDQTVARSIVLRVVVDALGGLHAAHEAHDELGGPLGIVHRDISPQNILVGTDGCTRITDFGVARASARLANTRKGSMKGKLAYMAPEQTKGDDLDRRADLFAMGIVLWEVLAAKRLFKGASEAQTLAKVLIDPIPRLRTVIPDLDAAVDEVVARSLDRDPAKRYQTAAEMADAVERAARIAEWGKSSMGIPASAAEAADVSPIATVRDVAALVREVCGDEISMQREAVRSWLAATPSSTGVRPPPSGVPASARLSAPPSPSSGRKAGPSARSAAPATVRAWPPVRETAVDDDVPLASDPSGRGDEDEHVPTKARLPVRGSAALDEDAGPAATARSAELPQRKGHGWLVAALLIALALGVGAFFLFRSRSTGKEETRPERAPTGRPVAASVSALASGAESEVASAASDALSEGETTTAVSTTSAPDPTTPLGTGGTQPVRPPPIVAPTALPPPPPPPPPATTTTKKGGEAEDLTNPYR